MSITVGLVQINYSFSDATYFPLSIGLLQAYVQQHAAHPRSIKFLEPKNCRMPVDHVVHQLQSANVVGFSTYVWNIKFSLAIARKLKELNPDVFIVFGGPAVPDRAEIFLRQNPFVDIVCHGEGEKVFLQILESFHSGNFRILESVSYIREEVFFLQPRMPRMKDLSTVPSPYLTGIFDGLLERGDRRQWLGLLETNRGCPFSCAYCDWGSATYNRLVPFDMKRLEDELRWFSDHKIEFVFCCDSNFGLLPRDLELVSFLAETKKRYGYPKAFSVQSTKNATERSYKVHKILSESGLNKGVNLALQTVDKKTLENIGRANISLESFRDLQSRFNRDGVETFTDLILGLPGETYHSFTQGVSQIIQNGQHNRIQFINLSILPNALMGNPEYQSKHGLDIVESNLTNVHGAMDSNNDEIQEIHQLVVATHTMPREDWVSTRVFAWMTSLLYFDKLIQIPFVLLHEMCGLSYTTLLESFIRKADASHPITSRINSFFAHRAKIIQAGGPEFCKSTEWLNISWPCDEYVLISLLVNNELEDFFKEASDIIYELLQNNRVNLPPFLEDALVLNRCLFKRPFQDTDKFVDLNYNIYECYKAVLAGERPVLEKTPVRYHVDRTTEAWMSWDDWFRRVVWFENKKGAYLYQARRI